MSNLIEKLYSRFKAVNQNVCTDSRKITEGCIFFALRGDNFNGNTFANDAIRKGAAYAVVDDNTLNKDERFIFCENVLITLQQMATFHRQQLTAKIIALTGSNGKTTTKELIYAVLSRQFKTHATVGNLNNHIGVPVTLLSLTPEHEFAVIEMGANHQKEIELLCKIAQPECGLITNVGKAHLEGFGGFEGVIIGKKELYDYLKTIQGKIFINSDNHYLKEMCGNYKNSVGYGNSDDCDYAGTIINSNPFLKIQWHAKKNPQHLNTVQSKLTGDYNFENILAAVCVGDYFGVEKDFINQGIENYFPANQRSQVITKNSNTFILDYYNANPTSMEAALVNFDKAYTGKKIVVLGDMLELGNETQKEHLAIINLLRKRNFSEVILIGKYFSEFSNQIKASFFETSDDAKNFFLNKKFTESYFLIKGSRGLKMEKVMEAFNI